MPEVRPLIRSDRDGRASLANRDIAAVLPGGAVPIASLLSQLERDAHEPIVDPWVVERHKVVAVDRDRLVAAAYLKRYGTEARVSESYKNLGEIDWLIFDLRKHDAGRAVIDAATAHLASWGVREWGVDGNLRCLGVSASRTHGPMCNSSCVKRASTAKEGRSRRLGLQPTSRTRRGWHRRAGRYSHHTST